MKLNDSIIAHVRAVIARAGKPLTIDALVPRVEGRMKRIVGRARLYRLLSVMAATTGEIIIAGRGAERTYDVAQPKE